MRSAPKLFRVIFTDTRYMRIDLDARFVDFGGDAFHDAEAEEVQS